MKATERKTVFARMSNVKLNILEDEDGNDISGELNNVEQTLGRIGIALRKSPTEWNNFGSVLDQLSVKWKELSSVDQSAIATALGGVRQKEAVLTMMENYDKVLQYEKTAMESSGTALEKFNNAYLGSIEAKTNAFKASFESFSMSIINSNVLKTITDIGSATLSWLDGTDKIVPTFYRILGVATAIGVVLKKNAILSGINMYAQYGSTIGAFGAGGAAGLKALTAATQGLSKARLMNVISTNNLNVSEASKLLIGNSVERQERIAILTKLGYIEAEKAQTVSVITHKGALLSKRLIAQGVSDEERMAILTKMGYVKVQNTQTLSTTTLATATKGLGLAMKDALVSTWAFLSTNPVGWAILAVGAVASVIKITDKMKQKYIETQDEIIKKSSETIEKATSEKDALTQLQSSLIDAKGNKEKLAAISDELNKTVGIGIGFINGESDAYEIVNEKIRARIRLKEAEIKAESDARVEAEKNKFDNPVISVKWAPDADKKMIDQTLALLQPYLDAGKTMNEAMEQLTIDNKGFAENNYLTAEMISEHITSQTELAKSIFSEFINSQTSGGLVGSKFFDKIIEDAVTSGKSLTDIQTLINSTIPDVKTLNGLIDNYIKSAKTGSKTSELVINQSMWDAKKIKDIWSSTLLTNKQTGEVFFAGMSDTYVTPENLLNDIKLYPELAQAFKDAGIIIEKTTQSEAFDKIQSQFMAMADKYGISKDLIIEYSSMIANAISGIESAEPIDKVTESIGSLGKSFDTFKGRLSDLEEIQKNSNKGYEFSYNEITKIKEQYPELIEYITRSANGWTIAKNSVNMFSTGVRFTAEEIAFLQKDHKNLNATLDEATGLYYLNSEALGILGTSALQAKINFNQFQVDATKAAIDGARERIDALKAETAALTTFMATSALVKQSGDTGTVLTSSEFWMMKRDGLASVSGYSNYDEYTAGRVSGTSGSQMQSLLEAQKQLDEYQTILNDIGTNPTSGASAGSAEELLRKQIQAQKDAFEREKAVIDSQLSQNIITQKKYADELLRLNEKYFSDKTLYLEEYVKNEADIYSARQKGLKDAEKAISDLAKMTEDMIKKEKELEKDALETKKDNLKEEMEKEEKSLEKKKDNLKEYTDARKKALEDARDQDKYDKEVREKSKDIETIKAQLLGLSGDMSGAGMRKKKELEQTLKDTQDELGEAVSDRQYDTQINTIEESYNAQEKALESQIEKIKTTYETQEKEFEARIKTIEMYLDSEGQITADAYNRLNGLNSSFYNDLMEYNKQYGTGINNDITNQWKLATSALMEYGGTLSNIQGTYATISTSIGQVTGYATGTSGLKRDSIIVGTHELLLNKTGSNAYQMMNAGSPIFTEQQTNALKALLSSPSSLLTKTVGGVGLNNASTIMSMANSNNSQDIDLHYEFNISGTDPVGIESTIIKLLPKIKDYTLSAINKDVQFNKGVRLTASNMA